ncbi:ChbG/HpnK family deacetylase [Candidatus Nomurabacteria bacterium]|nr:ChbG/HpnK family deacetylase [Candidatus Nomurabacteria bacterium]
MIRIDVIADDYGLSSAINTTILECIDQGVLTGVSMLANGEALEDAVVRYVPRANLASLAVHLNLTEGKALSPSDMIPLLVDGVGNFRHSVASLWLHYVYASSAVKAQYRAQVGFELRAQLDRIRALLAPHNLSVSAVDGHQHAHMIPFVFDEVLTLPGISRVRISAEPWYFAPSSFGSLIGVHAFARIVLSFLGRRNRALAREAGLTAPDTFLGVMHSGRMTYAAVRAGLTQVASGHHVEIGVHPGIATETELIRWREGRADIAWHYSPWRAREHALVCSNDLRELLAAYRGGASLPRLPIVRMVLRYLVSGTIVAAVDFSLLYLFAEIFGWWYIAAATAALMVAFFVSFTLQKFWTFSDRSTHGVGTQLKLFLIMNVFNLAANAYLLHLLVEEYGMWYMAAEFAILLAIAAWSFLIMRFVIFRS